MNWINKLERKFGRYAISNLMLYVTIMYAAGFLIVLLVKFYNLTTWRVLHAQSLSRV